ncbi:MAG: SpaH/EbpB family LPXTG-anchored major pilin [Promicromonosporaceae bacterium]|nr:SpaH/EbpB family LPXTG-anchored major pilin [Promicromonosporaceae bacterium]
MKLKYRLASLASLAVAALAATAVVAPIASANVLPPAGGTGTLNVVVTEAPATGDTNNGLQIPNITNGVPGATVRIYLLPDFNLATNAGWEALAAVAPAVPSVAGLTAHATLTTDADGVASFPNLPMGAFVVLVDNMPYQQMAPNPFLVTMPFRNPAHPAVEGEGPWLWDVWAYPKSGDYGITKSAPSDVDVIAVGDIVTWTIRADVPDTPADQPLTDFRIQDALDHRLSFDSAALYLFEGENQTPLAVPGDVTLTETTVTQGVGEDAVTREVLTWTFTEAGLDLLNAAGAGAFVEILLDTEVRDLGDGDITNRAFLFVNDPSSDWEDNVAACPPSHPDFPLCENGPGTGTPEIPLLRRGDLVLNKYSLSGETPARLAGATFQLFRTEADALAQDNPITMGEAPNVVSSWTTDADGTFRIPGLAQGATFWLVETVAAPGYTLLVEPVSVTMVIGTTENPNPDTVVNVNNVASNAGFQLPITGGMGATIFGIGSLVVMGTAALLAIGGRKKKASNA